MDSEPAGNSQEAMRLRSGNSFLKVPQKPDPWAAWAAWAFNWSKLLPAKNSGSLAVSIFPKLPKHSKLGGIQLW